jgi:hypothetical protein
MNRTFEGNFLNDTESAKLRLNTSHLRQRRLRNHENSTGPGDYETTSAFFRQSLSKNITSPAFTMRGRTRGAVVSKRHVQDWTGLGTPGAGNYEAKSLDAGLRYSVSKQQRFRVPKGATDKAPHAFEMRSTLSKFGCGIARDHRFHYSRDEAKIEKRSPGPGTYEAKGTFKRLGQRMNGLGKIRRFEEKSIDKAVAKDFRCRETPGPGEYGFSSDFNKGKAYGKINPPGKSRKPESGVDQVGDYDQQRIKVKPKAPQFSFGSAKRFYDPKYYRVENQKLYAKGLL